MFEVNTMVYWFLACSSLACDFQSAPPQPWVCSYIALLFTADPSVFPLWIHSPDRKKQTLVKRNGGVLSEIGISRWKTIPSAKRRAAPVTAWSWQ